MTGLLCICLVEMLAILHLSPEELTWLPQKSKYCSYLCSEGRCQEKNIWSYAHQEGRLILTSCQACENELSSICHHFRHFFRTSFRMASHPSWPLLPQGATKGMLSQGASEPYNVYWVHLSDQREWYLPCSFIAHIHGDSMYACSLRSVLSMPMLYMSGRRRAWRCC